MIPATPGWVVWNTKDGTSGLVVAWICDSEAGNYRPLVVINGSGVATLVEPTDVNLYYSPSDWPAS